MRSLICYIILFLLSGRLWADVPPILEVRTDPYQKFELFDQWPDDEHGTVTDILQDSTGNIWFATTNGLYRFDGFRTRKYINDWKPGALPDNYVNDLHIAPETGLLVGTKSGLCVYNKEKDLFLPLFIPHEGQAASDTFNIRALMHQGDSLLWFDTHAGILNKMDLRKKRAITKKYAHGKPSQPYYLYHALEVAPDGSIWTGGRGNGPFILDTEQQKLRYFHTVGIRGANKLERLNDVADLFRDGQGDFWMACLSGLYFLDNDSLKIFMEASSWDITNTKSGEYWFGSGDRLARYNRNKGQLTLYPYNEENPHSLPGNYIHRIFEDRSGRIWISTNHGLAHLKPRPAGLEAFTHIPAMENTPASNNITQLENDGKNGIWLATAHHGIDHLQLNTGHIKHFAPHNTDGMPSGNVRCFIKDGRGGLYLGLWSGTGFGRLDTTAGTYENYAFNPKSRSDDWYNDLLLDKDGLLYLGFWGGKGLTTFDTAKKEYSRFLTLKFSPSFNARLITCLHSDAKGNIWMGTTQAGLHCYQPADDTAISYFKPTNPLFGIDDEHIFDIADGPGNNIWIAGTGLYSTQKERDSLKKLVVPGLSEGALFYKILTENDTAVWLLGNKGTFLFNPRSNKINSLNDLIGMEYTEINAAATLLPDGGIAFGGTQGIITIKKGLAASFATNDHHLFFSNLDVFDQPKIHNPVNMGAYELKHSENFFTVKMGGDWTDAKDVSASYFLEGFQKDWRILEANSAAASFTNVNPGDYVFRARLSKVDSGEILREIKMNINILPPWWQRWWFPGSSFLILSAITALFIRNRLHALRLRISVAELNQKLLRLQMNPHFIFNSLFAIQNYIYSQQTHLAGKYLSDFAKLIRMILNYSRSETISIEREIETTTLYLELQKLRFGDKMEYHLYADPKLYELDLFVPPMLAQPFVENAIEHGIKNLDKTGKLEIRYVYQSRNIIFEIRDNGIGIEATSQKKGKTGHKSLATDIVRERLDIISRKTGKPTSFDINGLTDDHGRVKGTLVKIMIPAQIANA